MWETCAILPPLQELAETFVSQFPEVERNPWLDAGRHERVKSFGKRNIIAGSMDKVTAMVNNNAVAQPMPIV